jgi:hypothetical protein
MPIRYIFNSSGQYVAFLDGEHLFSPKSDWLGFLRNGNEVYADNGAFMGYLLEDDRIVRNKRERPRPRQLPPLRPLKPLRPLRPLHRLRMPRLPPPYEDVFERPLITKNTWPRDRYTGPGGGLYTGPGGGMYTGPGGGAYTGPGGGLYTGPGGGMYTGPDGGLYTGAGGGLYTGPGGGMSAGPGGGLYAGPGGGLYSGPGGGLYTGPCADPYRSNLPPREFLLEYLEANGFQEFLELLLSNGF